MPRVTDHPKRCKYCVFCEYWTGDANMVLTSPIAGYTYENSARGKCVKGNMTIHAGGTCSKYEPSREAKKLM